MAGRFIRTQTMNSEMPSINASNAKSLLNNPYYLFNNSSASVCTYYNINTTMTTLDESTRVNYSEINPTSPIRFNEIDGFYIYGINKIEPNLEVGEFGLEASDVQGDAIILPNTIIPYPGDHFTLNQINKPYLFKVTAVNPNTLDTGATMYKINYMLLCTDGVSNIIPQVVKKFNFYIENYGSNFGCLIESSTVSKVKELERYVTVLKDYYIQIFYDNKIQSFSYLRNGCMKVYDPYLIEFIIRNNILKGSTNYIYVGQQVYLPSTFGVDYDRTFFAALEDKDLDKHYCRFTGNLIECTQKLSLLYAYPQKYYCMEYAHINTRLNVIDIFNDPEFVEKINNNEETNNILKNIIIKYFNDTEINDGDLSSLKHVDYMENADLYYLIPFAIYCIEKNIANMLN